jgi:hypothetical protein
MTPSFGLNTEDGGGVFLRNVEISQPDYLM